MKRKLIKRNKQFLSSRYGTYLGDDGAFQRVTFHTVYFTKDNRIIFKAVRYKWRWCFNAEWFSDLRGEVHD